jgi:hypothetical protein
MVKPDVGMIDDGIKTQAAIKACAGLENAQWKDLVDRVKEFITLMEEETAKTPRSWKKDNWKELAKTFVENFGGEGAGMEFWHTAREADPDTAFMWPADREM